MDKARSLAKVPLFEAVEPAVRSALASHAHVVERKKRQSVIRQGAVSDAIFVVIEGHLKVSLQSLDGAPASLSVLGPGEIFGELGVLGGVARSAQLTALDEVRLLRIPGPAFLDALSKSPALGLSLSRLLALRLRTIADQFGDVAGLQAQTRFARRLLALFERFGRRGESGMVLDVALNQEDLAELVQLSRQRTNGLLQELKRRGIFGKEGRYLVCLDLQALRELAVNSGPPLA